MTSEEKTASLELLNTGFGIVPQNVALGLSLTDVSMEPAWVIGRLPWSARIVGNPELGTVHGGVVTTFLDALGGAAVYVKMQTPSAIVTLDLRIDYLKPSAAQRDIHARAECIKVTKQVAFVRAIAYHDDLDDPIALMSATYVITNRGTAVFGP